LGLGNAALDLGSRGFDDALGLVQHWLHLAAHLIEALGKLLAHLPSGLGRVEQRNRPANDRSVHNASQVPHRFLLGGGQAPAADPGVYLIIPTRFRYSGDIKIE